MSRAYLRLDPGFFERKMVDQGYSAGELAALVGALCLAEQQVHRGRFRNARLLRALLADVGKYVPALIRRGDLIVQDEGRLYVDGWDEWQEGDVTVRERMVRVRGRKHGDGSERNTDRNSTVPPLSGGGAVAESGAGQACADEVTEDAWTAPEAAALSWLHAHKCLIREGDGHHRNLMHAAERHGSDALLAEFERLAKAGTRDGDLKGFLYAAVDLLDKRTRPNLSQLEEAEKQAERDAEWQRRVEATQRRAAELRGEAYS